MLSQIEMDDLSAKRGEAEQKVTYPPPPQRSDVLNEPSPAEDQAVAVWAWAAAILLVTLAVPLIAFPSFLLFLSESGGNSDERRTALTPLETFLALHSGILLLALSASVIFNIPSATPVAVKSTSPQQHPLLIPLTVAFAVIAFSSYNTISVGSVPSLFCFSSAVISLWGFWTILFAGSSSISRKTGADKRTSRFIFGNKSAASSQKKQWKKEHGVK